MDEKDGLGNNRIPIPLPRLHRFPPPRRAQTPFTTRLHAGDRPEIIPARSREFEEFFRYRRCRPNASVSHNFLLLRERGEGGYRRWRDFPRLRVRCGSNRRGRNPSWVFGRRGRGVCGRLDLKGLALKYIRPSELRCVNHHPTTNLPFKFL